LGQSVKEFRAGASHHAEEHDGDAAA